jgi:hypothetical protein
MTKSVNPLLHRFDLFRLVQGHRFERDRYGTCSRPVTAGPSRTLG